MGQVDWYNCTPELLLLIFEMLDIESLRNCLFVNKRWKDMADYTLQHQGLWQKLVEKEMEEHGELFRTKSKLSWKDIYANSLLWLDVKNAHIQHVHTYKLNVIKVNIYKDNLIVVTNSCVKYFNVATFEKIRDIQTKCIDFNESDHIVVYVTQAKSKKMLLIHGKMDPDDFNMNFESKELLQDLNFFELVFNSCYALTSNNVMMCFTWEQSKWTCKCLGRYYGQSRSLHSIHVYQDQVYIMLKAGYVMWNDCDSYHNFILIHKIKAPHFVINSVPYISCKFSTVFADKNKRCMKLCDEDEGRFFSLDYPDLKCTAEHGQVLLVASGNGKIDLCIPENMAKNGNIPDLTYDLQLKVGETIKAFDIHEAERSHHLFAVTSKYIYQLHITHPNNTLL